MGLLYNRLILEAAIRLIYQVQNHSFQPRLQHFEVSGRWQPFGQRKVDICDIYRNLQTNAKFKLQLLYDLFEVLTTHKALWELLRNSAEAEKGTVQHIPVAIFQHFQELSESTVYCLFHVALLHPTEQRAQSP